MYVELPANEGSVGDKRKVHGLTYEKAGNGKWTLVRNKALKCLFTRLYEVEKKTLRDITEETGIPHSTVQKVVNHFSLMRKKKPMTDEEVFKLCNKNHDLFVRLYHDKGWVQSRIAAEVRKRTGKPFKSNMLRRYFKKVGVPVKTHKEALETASKFGRMRGPDRGLALFAQRSIKAWDEHLDRDLTNLTYTQYKRIVRRFTYMTVKRYPQLVPKEWDSRYRRANGTGSEFHLDHQFAVASGYYKFEDSEYVPRERPIALTIMCHPANLKLMTATSNVRKGSTNRFSLGKLKKRIKEFAKEHGDIYDDYYGKFSKDQLIDFYKDLDEECRNG